MTASAEVAAAPHQLVSFYVDERLYGLDIRVVKEINPNVEITPVPHTQPHIRGLVNIRGQVVLVIDVAVVLGRPLRPVTPESHIVILKTAAELARVESLGDWAAVAAFGDKPVAILVDRIRDVVTIRADELEKVPAHLDEANARCFAGLVRWDEEVQVVLRAEEML
jgi:purine-binding chemotaxis protein CheW